ncbi:MAG: hypothetical protein WD851_17455 [Pirellulales bacterium]
MELIHWLYSFGLNTCNFGDRFRLGINPFTGEEVRFPIDDGLSGHQIRSVKSVFALHGIRGPEPECEGYAFYGVDGESVRFRGSDFEKDSVVSMAVEITVKKLVDEIVSIVFDVAKAGGFALSSDAGDSVRILDRELDATILARWPDAQLIRSVRELRIWIEQVIGAQQGLW